MGVIPTAHYCPLSDKYALFKALSHDFEHPFTLQNTLVKEFYGIFYGIILRECE